MHCIMIPARGPQTKFFRDNSSIWRTCQQVLRAKHLLTSALVAIAKIALQRLHCKDCIAEIPLQRLHCRDCIAKVALQRLHCRDCIAKVALQRMHCKGCIAKNALQRLHRNFVWGPRAGIIRHFLKEMKEKMSCAA